MSDRPPIRCRRTAARIAGLVQSDIRRMTRACDAVGGINLGQGICDLPTPPVVAAAAKQAIDERQSTYSRYEGAEILRRAIATKLARDNAIPGVDPESQVVVTVGATGAFAAACQALLDPGDEVIVFAPYYGYHLNILRVAGVAVRVVPLQPPGWAVDAADVEAVVTPRTRAIVLCTPANPCGKVWTRAEIAAVGAVAERHDLLLLTDEIYEYITFDRPHVSPASVGRLAERTVTMGGFSKTFSITGWRIGYAVAPADLAGPIGLVNDLHYVCAPTPLQIGVAHGILELPAAYYRDLAADYHAKRDRLVDAVGRAGFAPHPPEGAYYLLADFTGLGWTDAVAAARAVLERARVAAVPGTAFDDGPVGNRLLRFCFAKEWGVLEEACRRIATADLGRGNGRASGAGR
ncbi:MAG: pyridoxal phosphate-dependent aminotransferase [Candidatus Binatia bacterium]